MRLQAPRAAVALAITAAASLSQPIAAQVVLFEDFETPAVADYATYFAPSEILTAANTWAVTLASVDLYNDLARPEAVAYDGLQAVDLAGSPGAGVMETVFPTIPGAQYQLVFYYARNNLLGATVGEAEVDVIGAAPLLHAAIQHDPALYAFNIHLEFADAFVADTTETLLRFTSLNGGTTGITIDAISVTQTGGVGVEGVPGADTDRLLAAQPNPFRGSTQLHLVAGRPGPLELQLYDVRGRLVRTLFRGEVRPGVRTVSWDGRDSRGAQVAPGVYLCAMRTEQGTQSRRIVRLD